MEEILLSLSEYKILIFIIGFFATFVESFIPVLPLTAIIVFNANLFGMMFGYIISLTGSVCASIILYIIFNKFSNTSYVKKILSKNNVDKFSKFLKKQGFSAIFVSYLCPFIPDFLITISSGLISFDFKKFIYGMISGKAIMFLLISYLGHDFENLYKNPTKLILFVVVLGIAWYLGNIVNKKIDEHK